MARIVHHFNHESGPPEQQAEIMRRALDLIASHLPENGNQLATKEIERLMNEDMETAMNVFFTLGAIASGFVQGMALGAEMSPTEYLAELERDFREDIGA